MTAEADKQLENALSELSVWRGETPKLWRRALVATARKGGFRPRLAGLMRHRATGLAAACIAIVALGAAIVFHLPNLPSADASRGASGGASRFDFEKYDRRSLGYQVARGFSANDSTERFGQFSGGKPLASLGHVGDEARVQELAGADQMGRDGAFAGRYAADVPSGPPAGAPPREKFPGAGVADASQAASSESRRIVRKATVELLTKDVRAVFLKAGMIIDEAGGEYVQDSSITGSGDKTQANITLRVAAARLSAALNALRDLGQVRSEQITGEDVTTQVVDLEARLRNEQRVEAELLDLLEKRNDAPLKEILELRTTLADVRGNIERMTAERERLGRLVSLATVLVIIRSDETQLQPQTSSMGDYFLNSLKTAWRKGLLLLFDTFTSIVSMIVGGLIWWILLIVAIAMIRRYWRRTASTTKS